MFFEKLKHGRKYKLRWLKSDDILPNPFGIRRDQDESGLAALCESVRRHGIIQPLLVQRREDGAFQLVSGERRLLAARRCAIPRVPCILLPPCSTKSALIPITEAIHSRLPDVFEEAAAIRRMMDTQRLGRGHCAALLGIPESAVGAKLSALKLNDAQRQRALELGLGPREIRAVANADAEKRWSVLEGTSTDENERRQRICGAADLRFFDNSVNRLVESATAAGMKAGCTRRNTAHGVEYVIRINKSDEPQRQLTLF